MAKSRHRGQDPIADTRYREIAARVERAPGRAVIGVWHHAADRTQADPGVLTEARNRLQEGAGVGMLRLVEDLVDRAALDHHAEVHHGHFVGDFGNDTEVVGDEDHRHAQLVLQTLHEFEDLGLGGDVEGGGRLIGDQQGRVVGQSHGDHGPLAQAATQLIGERVVAVFGAGHPYLAEHFDRVQPRLFRRHGGVQANVLRDLVPDRVHHAEGGHRLLEDHRDLLAADAPDQAPLRIDTGEVDRGPNASHGIGAVEEHFAADDLAGRLHDLQDRAGCHALAAPALAHNAERLAAFNVEGGAIEGLDRALIEREPGFEVADFQQEVFRCGFRNDSGRMGGCCHVDRFLRHAA